MSRRAWRSYPNNKFAFVANAAGSSVTVIKITNAEYGKFAASVEKTVKTGAEPWNIVISSDGKRVFVANSGQDTITVINAVTRNIIGHVNLRNSLCNDPDRTRHFQPRGLAVTQDNQHLYVTRFLSFTKSGGKQGADNGKEGVVCRLDINTNASQIAGYQPAAVIPLAAQLTGFAIAGVPGTDSAAFPNQLQSIVIRGKRAFLPNIAASPQGPLQFQNSKEAFVNVIKGVNENSESDGGALNLHLGARNPEPGKKMLFAVRAREDRPGPTPLQAVRRYRDLLPVEDHLLAGLRRVCGERSAGHQLADQAVGAFAGAEDVFEPAL